MGCTSAAGAITTITITMATISTRGAAEAAVGEGEASRHSGPVTEVAVVAGASDPLLIVLLIVIKIEFLFTNLTHMFKVIYIECGAL